MSAGYAYHGIMINRDPYDFKAPLRPEATDAQDPLVGALIETRAFRRLRSIRFLGGIDYLRVPAPNGRLGSRRYTRHQHSLGVARLALLYCDIAEVGGAERRLIGLAALLHDIGHAPLSHSLEPVFTQMFGLDHHRATAAIIRGEVPLGHEVHAKLRAGGIDVERLLALIDGQDSSHGGFFDGPINFDTIEGILRTQTYEKPTPKVASPETVLVAATRRADEADRIAVDEFWSYKDLVYRFIINGNQGVLADAACQAFMRRNAERFGPDDYYSTEHRLFSKLPGLHDLLTHPDFDHLIGAELQATVRFKARRFMVDPAGDFFAREDHRRYRQTKLDATVQRPMTATGDTWQDLFDDDAGH